MGKPDPHLIGLRAHQGARSERFAEAGIGGLAEHENQLSVGHSHLNT